MNTQSKYIVRNSLVRILQLIFVISFIVPEILYSQNAPEIEWQKCLGGSADDYVTAILQTSDDGYVIAGWTDSYDGDVIGHHKGAGSIWILKLDSYGEILWQECIGGNGQGGINCMIQTSDGGYAATGWTNSTDGDLSQNHGGVDAWVVKLDSSGNIKWQKCLGGTGEERANSIIESSEEGKGYVIAGYTTSTNGDVIGKHSGSDDSASDAWIVKLSSSGTFEWQKCLGGSNADAAYSVIQTLDGSFMVAAQTHSNDGDVSGNHGNKDAWIVKLNSSGNIQWQKCFGGIQEDGAISIIRTFDGGYAIVGGTTSTDGNVQGYHPYINAAIHSQDIWMVKINSSGNMEWQKCLGGSHDEWVSLTSPIIQTSDGGYTICGNTRSKDGDLFGIRKDSGNPNSTDTYSDIWIVRLNSSGNIIWQKCLGGTGWDIANSLIKTSNGGYAVAGYTQSIDGDVSGIHQSNISNQTSDGWIVKLKPDGGSGNVIDNDYINAVSNFLKIYPNPSVDRVNFQLRSTSIVKQIQLYDVMGVQQFLENRLQGSSAVVDVHNLSNGIYFTRIIYIRKGITGSFALPFIVRH